MIPLKIILCIFVSLQSTEAFGFSRNYTYTRENSHIHIDWPKIYGDRIHLNFADCTRKNKENFFRCQIIQEISKYDDSADIISNRSCNFNFGKFLLPLRLIKLDVLDGDRIIFDMTYAKVNSYTVKNNSTGNKIPTGRKFQILNMNNCQLINEVELTNDSVFDYLANLLIRPDKSGKFDIFYMDLKSCNNSRVRQTFDQDGKHVDGPVCLLDNIASSEKPRKKEGSDFMSFSNESYFVLDRNGKNYSGYLVSYTENDSKEIFSGKCKSRGCSPDIRVSTKHNRIRYCILGNSYADVINCTQFDVNTSKKTKIPIQYPYKVLEFELLNLKNDDFLTLTGQYRYEKPQTAIQDDDEHSNDKTLRKERSFNRKFLSNQKYDNKEDVPAEFELRQYSNDGKIKSEPIKVNGLSCRNPLVRGRANIMEIGENKVCINYSCRNVRKIAKGDYTVDYKIATQCVELKI